jgi:hypothetical protein
VVQGHDQGADQCDGGLLSGVGPLNYPRHHLRTNVIISEEAKTLHFVSQMYKSDSFTKEQMTKYKMQSDTDKVWTTTLQFFTNLYAQRNAYGNNSAANSGFDSAALVHECPPQPKRSSHRCQHNQRHHNMGPLHRESQRVTGSGTRICRQGASPGHSH